MKKVITSFAIVAMLVTNTFADNNLSKDSDVPVSNIIKWNWLSAILKTANFAYERSINEKQSVQLRAYYCAYSFDKELNYTRYSFMPEFRQYLSKDEAELNGFFIAPLFQYVYNELSNSTGDKATLTTYGGGLCFGYQKVFSNIFSVDVFTGPTYDFGGEINVKSNAGGTVFKSDGIGAGFGFKFGTTFGIAF